MHSRSPFECHVKYSMFCWQILSTWENCPIHTTSTQTSNFACSFTLLATMLRAPISKRDFNTLEKPYQYICTLLFEPSDVCPANIFVFQLPTLQFIQSSCQTPSSPHSLISAVWPWMVLTYLCGYQVNMLRRSTGEKE